MEEWRGVHKMQHLNFNYTASVISSTMTSSTLMPNVPSPMMTVSSVVVDDGGPLGTGTGDWIGPASDSTAEVGCSSTGGATST